MKEIMKKILIALLCILPLASSAQTVYGFGAGYDYDSATSNRLGLSSVSKESILVGSRSNVYGNFDAGLFNVHVKGNGFSDNQPGAELGYGYGIPVGPVILSGRIAVGKVWNRGLGSPSDTGLYNTYAATIGLPLTKQWSVGTTFRYRPERDFEVQKQYGVGVTYLVSKEMSVQASLRQTKTNNQPILNGIAIQVLHAF